MKTIYSLIFTFVLSISALTYVEVIEFNKRVSALVTNEEELVSITYKTIIDAYEKNANILFNTVISNEKILKIFYKASTTKDKEVLKTCRQKLYLSLLREYNTLKPFDIKQLHFHLKNNDSFLRFHRPAKFGDNLTKARKTVAFVNKEHKNISGFEEGKIFNGYRFVFPLSYKNEHMGSVEISISMNAIIKAIRHNLKSDINFIMSKKIVGNKVFKNEKSNYIASDISPNFLYEKSIHASSNSDIKKYLDNYDFKGKDLETILSTGKIFTFISTFKDTSKIITFYPIKNVVTKQTVAYIVLQKKSNEVAALKSVLYTVWFSLVFVIILALVAYYRVKRSQEIAYMATQTKSLFLANMSHEIRTPMNAIIGFSDILIKSDLDENQKKHLSYIKSSSSNLLAIINDILDFSKVEAGKLTLEEIPFNMKELTQNLHSILDVMAKEKDLTFLLKYNTPYDGDIIGDPTRVGQIIINIANNAIKFTSHGSVKIFITTLNETLDAIEYQIIIKDTGIGMSKETVAKLFTCFEQADSSTNRKYGGTGLGLSITKSLINMMRGKIDVRSKEGEGSEFIVSIKTQKYFNNTNDSKALNQENTDIDLGSLAILVVEDNKTNQVLIDIILDEYGIDADIANNGLEAVNILKEKTYDLILMDIQMPNMNGYEATKFIRDKKSDVINHEVEIVALSANATVEDIKLSSAAGMNNHLSKPIEAKKLHEVLVQNLKKKEKTNG